jgi:uncharacterized protein (DUF362 family)
MADRPRVGFDASPGVGYPRTPPFDPSETYPELARLPGGHPPRADEPNPVYALVRRTLASFGLDRARFGTADWNPLEALVPREGLVVLKPNLVLEASRSGDSADALVTHGSVVRVLVDYVRLAGGDRVEILIADVPLQGADFTRIVQQNGLRAMVEMLARRGDGRLALRDLRRERAIVDSTGFITRIEPLAGDPRGYQEVDVATGSRLEGLSPETFEGFAVTDYQQATTLVAHAPGRHVYLVPRSVLDASLFINIPKLKTHQKAGITVALKNLVGVNGDKARIPHFRRGGSGIGDEYPPDQAWLRGLVSRAQRLLQGRSSITYRAARRVWRTTRGLLISRSSPERVGGAQTLVGGGAWFGNDTLWRALHDLNLLVLFADSTGVVRSSRQRRYLCVVDGIVAGEGDGPLQPVPRRDGVIMVGDDALAVDLVAAHYMGLDWRRIPLLADAVARRPAWTRVEASLEQQGIDVAGPTTSLPAARVPFLPAPGWRSRMEK